MTTVKLMRAWLKKPGNTKAKMASLLGYADSNTIAQWICRNKVPAYQEERVRVIVTNKEGNNEYVQTAINSTKENK